MKIETKLTIKIGDQKITLNEQEAKELRDELFRIFGTTYQYFPQPTYPYPIVTNDATSGTVTLDNLSSSTTCTTSAYVTNI